MAEGSEDWGIVEIFGHIRHAGRVSEEERFGTRMGRVDVPTPSPCDACAGVKRCPACNGFPLDPGPCASCGGSGDCPGCGGKGEVDGFASVYFGGAALFRLIPCTEAAARAVAAQSRPAPAHRLALPGSYRGRDEIDDADFGDDEDV